MAVTEWRNCRALAMHDASRLPREDGTQFRPDRSESAARFGLLP